MSSTSTVVSYNGLSVQSEQMYMPWGEKRPSGASALPTTYRYTGQRQESSLGPANGEGLYYYGARWYDPQLGRFTQPDTLTPTEQGVQAYDRYAYVNNNPVKYTDPTGHRNCREDGYNCNASNTTATKQALGLVANWFFETGPQSQTFGPSEPITQEIRYDEGMDKFREQWVAAGSPLPYTANMTADERHNGSWPGRVIKGVGVYFREHVKELGASILGFGSKDTKDHIDAIGGTIGSLDQVTVSDAGNGQIRFQVDNTMGLESFTRVPGTNFSFRRNRDRNEWGLGGSIEQHFYWYENK